MAVEKKVQFVLSGKDETGAAIISVKEGLDDAAREAEKASRQMIVAAKAFGIETAAEAQRMKDHYATAFMRMQQDGKATANEIAQAQMKMNQIAAASTVSEIKKITSAHKEAEVGIIAGNMAIGSSFAALQSAMLPVMATIGSLSGAWNVAKMAADAQSQEQILANLGVQYGQTSKQIIDTMKEASGGVLSTVDTIDVATRGLLSGLNVDQIVEVAGMAASIADATGKADAEVISILEKTIATGESRGLKTLTLSADFKKAHEEYAASIHKTVSALTLQERQAANMIAVQEMYNKQIKDTQYSLTFANDSMKKINNQMQDTALFLGKLAYAVGATAVAMVQSFIGAVEGVLANILERAASTAEGLANLTKNLPGGHVLGEVAHGIRTMTETMKDAQSQSNEYAQEAFRLAASLFNEVKGHADNRKAIDEETDAINTNKDAKAAAAEVDKANMELIKLGQQASAELAQQVNAANKEHESIIRSTMTAEEQKAQQMAALHAQEVILFGEKIAMEKEKERASAMSNASQRAELAKTEATLRQIATSMYNTFQQQYAATKSIGAAMEAAIKQAVAARINAIGQEEAVLAVKFGADALGYAASGNFASAGLAAGAALQHAATAALAGVAASVVSGGGGASGAAAGATGGGGTSPTTTTQPEPQKTTIIELTLPSSGNIAVKDVADFARMFQETLNAGNTYLKVNGQTI